MYFNPDSYILDRRWILESYIQGTTVARLSQSQFQSLGSLLATVHAIKVEAGTENLWRTLLSNSERFGNEEHHLNHPDPRLRRLVQGAQVLFSELQPKYDKVPKSLIHGDATPSNILTQSNQVALIDWELNRYSDPMAEFATIYYEDIEYNRGLWRLKITKEEKAALFTGYTSAGGVIDENRIRLWINHDKLGAALFLYWRIHNSGRPAENAQLEQYALDLENITSSLERTLNG